MNRDQAQVPRAARIRTMLYVDDNPADRKLIEAIVARRAEWRVLSAVNGNGGIELARAIRPDVILMDINLPDISGFKALEILRADPATAHIPAVALSVNGMPLNVESGLEAGFFRYMIKPIRVDELMKTLDEALESAERR